MSSINWLNYQYDADANVWVSPSGKRISQNDTVINSNNGSYHFFARPEEFINSVHGTRRVHLQMEGREEGGNSCWVSMTNDVEYNEEGFVSVHPLYQRYKDSSVLIVGAGPTTNSTNWKSIVDTHNIKNIWSMNHFFLNDDVALHKKLNLITLGNEVDFSHPKLQSIIKSNPELLIYLEPCFVKKNVNGFVTENLSRIGWFHLRYISKLGTAPRLIILSILSGAKDIYIVGFDGYSKDSNVIGHSFESNMSGKDGYDYKTWSDGIVIFWDYVLNYLQPKYNFNIYNLGYGHESNMSSLIPVYGV